MNGKLSIISALLKLDRPFKPPIVIEMTGLDRALVYYHLNKFCDAGYLSKVGKVYQIIDKDGLLNSLVEIAEATETSLMTHNGTWLSREQVDVLNRLAEALVSAKILEWDEADRFKQAYVERLDVTIKELKKQRKFINNSQRGHQAAVKFFKKSPHTLDEWYAALVRNLDIVPLTTEEQFIKAIKMGMELE